jgi:hypothetical protein
MTSLAEYSNRVWHGASLWGARSAALALLALALGAGAAPASMPAGFTDSTAISGRTNPTSVSFAPDGRIFVTEKSGKIWSYQSLSDTSPALFADLSSKVDDYWDRGLLGLAVPPAFPTDNHVYVLYTYDGRINGTAPTWNDAWPTPPGPTTDGCLVSGRLSQLTVSGNASTGELMLINDWCQQFPSHSIGTLLFGRDGYLYPGQARAPTSTPRTGDSSGTPTAATRRIRAVTLPARRERGCRLPPQRGARCKASRCAAPTAQQRSTARSSASTRRRGCGTRQSLRRKLGSQQGACHRVRHAQSLPLHISPGDG